MDGCGHSLPGRSEAKRKRKEKKKKKKEIKAKRKEKKERNRETEREREKSEINKKEKGRLFRLFFLLIFFFKEPVPLLLFLPGFTGFSLDFTGLYRVGTRFGRFQ